MNEKRKSTKTTKRKLLYKRKNSEENIKICNLNEQ